LVLRPLQDRDRPGEPARCRLGGFQIVLEVFGGNYALGGGFVIGLLRLGQLAQRLDDLIDWLG
jgi:hypothetical protein